MNKSNLIYRLIIAAVFFIAIVLFRNFYQPLQKGNNNPSQTTHGSPGLNRKINDLVLTKHAKCRMECRDITEDEIREILHSGNINYNKSNLSDVRGATYALEGYSHDKQHLRIIFAPERDKIVVVTCIDLDKEWQCDCN